jgi:hypothetical protein
MITVGMSFLMAETQAGIMREKPMLEGQSRTKKLRTSSPLLTMEDSISKSDDGGSGIHLTTTLGSTILESMGYTGGKGQSGVWQKIINQLPPHRVYIEPFMGGGAVMRAKRPADVNIGIDIYSAAITSFDAGDVPNLDLRCGDGILFLETYPWRGDELVYCDPPYLFMTRRAHRQLYQHEMTNEDHRRLLAVITRLPTQIIISGYWSEMYAEALSDWRAVTYQAMTRAGSPAIEWLWMNYDEPFELHDYRYLGENFRERERIKRKINRWKAKLEKMPHLERIAMSAALAEIEDRSRFKLEAQPSDAMMTASISRQH